MSGLAAAKLAFTTSAREVLQPLAGLGFRPSAVVAWWSCQAEHGTRSGNRGGIGFWTAEGAVAVAWRSDDGARSIRTEHAAEDAAILGLGAAAGSPAMRAEIRSFDPDGLTLRWTAPPAETWTVHALALGAADASARVGWTSAAEKTVDAEDLVLFVPATADKLTIGLAAASADGRAAAGYSALEGEPPGTVLAAQRIGAAGIEGTDRYGYLALSGVRARVAAEVSPRRPGRRRVRVGYRPEALLLFSWGLEPSSGPKKIGRLCIGAVAHESSGCTSWDDCNVESETTRTHVASSDEQTLLVANTQTGGVHAAGAASLDERGFVLDWQRQDGGRRQFVWVALGDRER